MESQTRVVTSLCMFEYVNFGCPAIRAVHKISVGFGRSRKRAKRVLSRCYRVTSKLQVVNFYPKQCGIEVCV